MERSEREAILRLLHAVASADGRIRPDGERALEAASRKLAVPTPTFETIDVAHEAARITTLKAKVAAFEAAVAIASMDDEACSPDKRAIIEKLRTLLPAETQVSVHEREERWFARFVEPRRRMAAAEVDFLHNMKEGIGAAEYCGLIADLHGARVAALRDELDSALEGRASYLDLDLYAESRWPVAGVGA